MSSFLFQIITEGSVGDLRQFLERDTRHLNEGDEDNLTPLHLAVGLDQDEMVSVLLDFGAEVNVHTFEADLTPLHIAVRNNNLKLVDRLLEVGADVNSRNKIDHTPLHIAVSTNSIEMVRLLLFWNAETNVITSDPRKESPLLKAATISLPLTRLLIDSGARLTTESKELHVAILANKAEIASLILDHMESCNDRDLIFLKPNRIGRSHLQSVASHIQNCDAQLAVNLAERLVRFGNDVNYANQFGTVFHILVSRGVDEVSSALFDYFLSVPGRNCDKYLPTHGTPLLLAMRLGQNEFAVRLIIDGFIDARTLHLNDYHLNSKSGRILKLLYFEGFRIPNQLLTSHWSMAGNAECESWDEFVSWAQMNTQSVLPLKALVRRCLRSFYKERCGDILSHLEVPRVLHNYVLYKSSSVEEDFL